MLKTRNRMQSILPYLSKLLYKSKKDARNPWGLGVGVCCTFIAKQNKIAQAWTEFDRTAGDIKLLEYANS